MTVAKGTGIIQMQCALKPSYSPAASKVTHVQKKGGWSTALASWKRLNVIRFRSLRLPLKGFPIAP